MGNNVSQGNPGEILLGVWITHPRTTYPTIQLIPPHRHSTAEIIPAHPTAFPAQGCTQFRPEFFPLRLPTIPRFIFLSPPIQQTNRN